MNKSEMLSHWASLPNDLPIKVEPIEYGKSGSNYSQDTIRITGSRTYIDSILSRLKDFLKYESAETRLQVLYNESKDRQSGEKLGSFNCYIQVHERGENARFSSYITDLNHTIESMTEADA